MKFGDVQPGKPLRPWRSDPKQRFWQKVSKTGPIAHHPATGADMGPCWHWTGHTCWKGYGRFKVNEHYKQAHRLAYEWEVGPIPIGLELDHLCRVRCCVNPAHLEPVEHRENVKRGDAGKNWASKTHCPGGHPYSGDNLYLRKDGKRQCLTCKREQGRVAARKYRERKQAAA